MRISVEPHVTSGKSVPEEVKAKPLDKVYASKVEEEQEKNIAELKKLGEQLTGPVYKSKPEGIAENVGLVPQTPTEASTTYVEKVEEKPPIGAISQIDKGVAGDNIPEYVSISKTNEEIKWTESQSFLYYALTDSTYNKNSVIKGLDQLPTENLYELISCLEKKYYGIYRDAPPINNMDIAVQLANTIILEVVSGDTYGNYLKCFSERGYTLLKQPRSGEVESYQFLSNGQILSSSK